MASIPAFGDTHFVSSFHTAVKPSKTPPNPLNPTILFPFPSATSAGKSTRTLCQASPSESPPKPPPNLAEQLQPLYQRLLSQSNTANSSPAQPLRKPKSTWVNPSRPRHSVLTLQRHKRLSHAWNPHLKELKVFVKKLNDCDLSQASLETSLAELEQPPSKEDALLILNSLRPWQKAHLFFNWLQTHHAEFASETVFYNVVMKSLRYGKQWEIVEGLAREMIQKGIAFDNVTYSTIITCAKKCRLFEKAIEWFDRMYHTGCMPDEVTYSAILDVYAKLGRVEDVLTLYERGRADGWQPDVVAFSVLGKMFGETGDYDGIRYVLEEMKSIGVRPNVIVYNTFLEALGKAGKPGLARSLFEEMTSAGLTPDAITLTALVKIYGKARWGRDALQLWQQMKLNKWPMDFILYNTLLSMCADLGLEDEAEKLFEDMRQSINCKPDSFSYTALLNIYASGGEVEKAQKLFEEMLESENKLNVMSSTCLIQCFGRARRIDDVARVFDVAVDRGIVPDDRMCGSLLSVASFCENDEVDKVLACLARVNPRLVRFVEMISNPGIDFEMVKEEFRAVLNEASVEVRRPFCNCLIDICRKRNLASRAHELLYLGVVFGLYSGLHTKSNSEWSLNLRNLSVGAAYTALEDWVRALSKAVQRDEALPESFAIHTGVGAHKFSKGLSSIFDSHLKKMASPFNLNDQRPGWFIASQDEVVSWVQNGDLSTLAAT
ncbi:pentatricopeptide repeat-containing protein At5g46580, chloroplastic-like [Nymphaea colorata]|uniref:Smr domain-containing protein n=1 Tax=Nymphaea colorata TaxID=210225 RepID=A0A5K0YUV6_9MAGN|nr:pentatricopeptide repeat-containing protein At5g46580, chloroplastic-like [Nymphaea colorata]VVV81007.1 unnamed protein product [Nymphaea colorata]